MNLFFVLLVIKKSGEPCIGDPHRFEQHCHGYRKNQITSIDEILEKIEIQVEGKINIPIIRTINWLLIRFLHDYPLEISGLFLNGRVDKFMPDWHDWCVSRWLIVWTARRAS